MLRPRTVRTLAAFGIAIVMVSSLGGCGRRGRLLPPPDPNAPAENAQPTKSGLRKKPPNPPIVTPNEPFLLDPLL